MKNASQFGLPRHEIKHVDFRDVSDHIKSVITTIQKHDSVERFCGLGAKVEFGNAVFINEHTVSLNGKDISAKNWVIATGSSPAIPKIEGLERNTFPDDRDILLSRPFAKVNACAWREPHLHRDAQASAG